ncbi:hypothetical protein ACSNOH_15140 [Streptomyces sp. URMC 127]|uniref:hypothetical protein n=1 Tax=Streptomyces sp. URMC 127 TaxID=3423402 RepID=UPI003F1B1C69
MTKSDHNEALTQVMKSAQISRKSLALRVNQLGIRYGLTLSYTHTSVSRWLAGSIPRGQTPILICEVISERIGRSLSLRELGFPPEICGSPEAEDYPAHIDDLVMRSLRGISSAPIHRRDFFRGAATFTSALYMRPTLRWLIEPSEDIQTRMTGPKVDLDTVERLLVQINAIRILDSQLGGGSLPGHMAKLCLNSEAIPALGGSYDTQVGRRLFSATAELARLTAWTSLDAGEHGTSQRYFIRALRFAKAASDVPFGAFVLGQASYGATFVGDFQTAIDLTTSAAKGVGDRASPKLASFLLLAQARAYARSGDRYRTERALARAQEALTAKEEDNRIGWLNFMLPSRIAADTAEAYLDLSLPALTLSQNDAVLSVPKSSYVRSHGLRLCVIATAYARNGEKEPALHYGQAAYLVVHRVNSNRLNAYFNRFLREIRKWSTDADVMELQEWLRSFDRAK